LVEAYIKMLSNYAVFSGRSRRKDFWLVFLANLIIGVIFSGLTAILPVLNILFGVFCLAVLIPNVALWVRRLHDTGKSGWWLLLSFVPTVGVFVLMAFVGLSGKLILLVLIPVISLIVLIVLIIFAATDSGPDNEYGPNPKTHATRA
jgi:uncharacterized membrane protein YhaH (DUF805 family)